LENIGISLCSVLVYIESVLGGAGLVCSQYIHVYTSWIYYFDLHSPVLVSRRVLGGHFFFDLHFFVLGSRLLLFLHLGYFFCVRLRPLVHLQRFLVFFFFLVASKGANAGVADADMDSDGLPNVDSVEGPDIDSDGLPNADSVEGADIDSDGLPNADSVEGPDIDSIEGPDGGGVISGGVVSGGFASGVTVAAAVGVSTDGPTPSGFELGVNAATARSNIDLSSSFFSGSGALSAMII
jgi:hypothetical protein